MIKPIPTLLCRSSAFALLIAGTAMVPAEAQQSEPTPPPAGGGFSLENIGRPTRETARPQVQGPVDPDAPIATQPVPRQTATPTPTQSNSAQPQRTSPTAPAITLTPPVSAQSADRRPAANRPAAVQAAPPNVAAGSSSPEQMPTQAAANSENAPSSTTLPAVRDPLADAPILRSDAGSGGFPWAWLLAALALIGGGVYFLRSRNTAWKPEIGTPLGETKTAPEAAKRDAAPKPDTVPKPPAPAQTETPDAALAGLAATQPEPEAAAPVAQSGDGIEVTFMPDYAAATFTRVAMRYVVTVRNSGSKPVTNLAIRAAMIPASAEQDREVAAFMADETRAVSHHIESLGAGKSIDIEGEMALPLAQARPVRYGQRLLFVPVAAFAIGFTRNKSARRLPLAYMVGVDSGGGGGKMGPLRLDLGPKTYNEVAQRPLALASAA